MARIEGFRIKNFRVLKDITIGKLSDTPKIPPLTSLIGVIGKNGVGKSTIFDAFGFLSDCLKNGVEEACDMRGRGGFDKVRSKGENGPIEFEIYYREDPKTPPITYELSLDLDISGRVYVHKECLRHYKKNQFRGRPYTFLILNSGKGFVWKGEYVGKQIDDTSSWDDLFRIIAGKSNQEIGERDFIELEDKRKLGIATLGSLKDHPRISLFRKFIEGWYLSYFTPDAARSLPLAGPQPLLNIHGDNLGNVVQFMERQDKEGFKRILENIQKKIPGIDRIKTQTSPDGRLLLCFNDKGFDDPFYAQQMSDGTLKLFAYLLLIESPTPPPFICIEEPENGLYHKLLEDLLVEFRMYSHEGGSQIFLTTHQPYLVNALTPEETWIIEKADDGFARIRRASDNELVKAMVDEGLPLGNLWYSDYLDER